MPQFGEDRFRRPGVLGVRLSEAFEQGSQEHGEVGRQGDIHTGENVLGLGMVLLDQPIHIVRYRRPASTGLRLQKDGMLLANYDYHRYA